jgi:hypothetical protein
MNTERSIISTGEEDGYYALTRETERDPRSAKSMGKYTT